MSHLLRGAIAVLALAMFGIASPSANAEPITMVTQSGGFQLHNLGNNGVPNGLDTLIGAAGVNTQVLDSNTASYVTTLNALTFTEGFTGFGSEGTFNFSFSQLLTVNGQTQVLNLAGLINIGTFEDSVTILGGDVLTFNFDTFSVVATVLPSSVYAFSNGDFFGTLSARFDVLPNNGEPVPEPATILLLSTGLAAVASRIHKRRQQKIQPE